MRQIINKALFFGWLGLALLGLTACGSTKVLTVGHCEIPQAYDYVAMGPADLPVMATPGREIIADDITQRGERSKLAADFNGLHDHVKGKCQ